MVECVVGGRLHKPGMLGPRAHGEVGFGENLDNCFRVSLVTKLRDMFNLGRPQSSRRMAVLD